MFTFLNRFAPLGHLLEALVVFCVLAAGFGVNPFAAAAIVAAVFYGREAGQREYELRTYTDIGSIRAWLGAVFLYRWVSGNWLQFGVPAFGVLVAAILTHYMPGWLPSFAKLHFV